MNTNNQFKGQVIIVTGASSGIGRETAFKFAKQGATLILAARTADKLQQVADEVRQINSSARSLVIPVDVISQEQVQAMVDSVMKEFGKIDILINNAGGGATGMIEQEDFIDKARHLMEADFYGKIYCAKAVLPIMRKQGSGVIVNLSSFVGLKAFPGFAAYSATMHAITGFSDSLRQELHGTGIHVATIHPALTQTAFIQDTNPADLPPPFRNMTPLTAETVAKQIIHAVLAKKSRVVIPWQPNMLFVSDALSAALGDLTVRYFQNRVVMRILGLYRGQTYRFKVNSKDDANFAETVH